MCCQDDGWPHLLEYQTSKLERKEEKLAERRKKSQLQVIALCLNTPPPPAGEPALLSLLADAIPGFHCAAGDNPPCLFEWAPLKRPPTPTTTLATFPRVACEPTVPWASPDPCDLSPTGGLNQAACGSAAPGVLAGIYWLFFLFLPLPLSLSHTHTHTHTVAL